MRIKIVHLITRLDPGGSSEAVRMIRDHLNPARFDCRLYSNREIPALRREISPVMDLLTLLHIYKMLRRERPLILHVHSSKAGFLGRWAGWLARVPNVVYTPHGHVFYGYFGPAMSALILYLEHLAAQATGRFVALTEGEKREWLERGVGSSERWMIIPSGWDPPAEWVSGDFKRGRDALRRELGIPDGATAIGTIARLEPVKGVDILLEAFIRLNPVPDNLRLVIIGDGSQRAALERRAREAGISSKLLFAGFRPEAAQYLPALDLYVQPSRNEGLGLTLLQAQAAGLPVVATSVCGIPDAICPDESALLAPPNDPAALAERIEEALSHRERWPEMSRAGRDWIATGRFSTETVLKQVSALYEEIARPAAPHPSTLEDPLDRFVHRPLAGVLLPLFSRWNWTPNQVTGLSFVAGLAGVACFWNWSRPAWIAGALLLELSILLDCLDGQLARARKMATELGDVFDHASDDIVFLSVIGTLAVQLHRHAGRDAWTLAVAGLVAAALTAGQFYYWESYARLYRSGTLGKWRADWNEARRGFSTGGSWYARVLYALRLGRLTVLRALLELTGPGRILLEDSVPKPELRAYYANHRVPMRFWRYSGMSALSFLLLLAAFAGRLDLFPKALCTAGAAALALGTFLQVRANRLTRLSGYGRVS